MNTLIFTCALGLTMLLSITFLASLLKLFFTADELTEMGVRLDFWDLDEEGVAL